MSAIEKLAPYLQKAAELFFAELTGHLNSIEELANSHKSAETIPDGVRAEISKRFHTIRGGAGFLKLNEIAEAATAGEKEALETQVKPTRILALTAEIRKHTV